MDEHEALVAELHATKRALRMALQALRRIAQTIKDDLEAIHEAEVWND